MGKLHFQASVGFAGGEQTKDYVRGFSNLNLVRKNSHIMQLYEQADYSTC